MLCIVKGVRLRGALGGCYNHGEKDWRGLTGGLLVPLIGALKGRGELMKRSPRTR